jgi:UDP:flavonoid glycosyltransferase YjiC (YdhE family)
MKLNTIKTFVLTVFALSSHQVCWQSVTAAQNVSSDKRLNIVVATTFGGKSHAIPMLEVCRELVARGHQITFISNDNTGEWAADQPEIKQVVMGAGYNERPDLRNRTSQLLAGLKYIDLDGLMGNFYRILYANHKEEVEKFYRLLTDESGATTDVVVCDALTLACIDVAHKLKIPFVVFSLSVDYDGEFSYIV